MPIFGVMPRKAPPIIGGATCEKRHLNWPSLSREKADHLLPECSLRDIVSLSGGRRSRYSKLHVAALVPTIADADHSAHTTSVPVRPRVAAPPPQLAPGDVSRRHLTGTTCSFLLHLD